MRMQLQETGVNKMNGKAIGDGLELAQVLMRWRSERGTTMAVFRAGRYRQLRLP